VVELPWPAITAASGGWVLTAAFVYAVLSGRLVPRSTLDSQVTMLNERIDDEQHEKSEWRTESRLKDQTVSELSDQNRAMLNAFGPTLTDFLSSLRRAGVGPTNSGDEQ
jgi:hypothetical protein